jgi:uncharacterized protein YggT (Ycf19 family)
MKNIIFGIISSIIIYLFYQGFVQSKLGQNVREEISRWFNQLFNKFRRK